MSGIMSMLLGAVSSAASAADEFFNRVTLLLNTGSTTGAQNNTFIDSSSNGYSITRNPATGPNAPTQGTFTPFSQTGWSNFFDGTDDYLAIADNALLRFGAGAFTLEAWIWRNVSGAAHTIYAKGGASTGVVFQVTSTNVLRFTHTTTNIDSTGTIAANSWTHVAVVREGTGANQTKLYINGTQDGQDIVSTDFTQTEEVRIGTDRGATADFNGYISNLRFVKGTALYTTTFTPSTTPLTTTSQGATATEVELLTCQSNRFLDNSLNTFAITTSGTPSVQTFEPFAPGSEYSTSVVGGSGYFDRTGDYLDVGSNSNLTIGTSNFTIAMWLYFNVIDGTTQVIFEGRPSSVADNVTPLITYSSVTSGLQYRVNNITAITGTASVIKSGQWYYVVVSRLSGTTRLFVNGAQQGSDYTDGNTYVAFASDRPRIADRGNSSGAGLAFSGYISGLQILIGTGISSSTIPTSPPTNVANTQLLLNYTNAGIYDSTAKNNLETVGSSQVAGGTYSPTATGTSGASTITVSSATGLKLGQSVTGTGIGTNAIVTNIVTTTVTLSVVNSGTVSGTMTFTDPSKFGASAIYFDGASDWLDFPVRGSDFGSGNFTIDLWFYKLSTGGQRLVSARSSNDGLTLGVNSSNLLTAFYGDTTASGTIAGTTTIAINTWYYVALVRSGGTTTLYLNGSVEGTPTSWSAKSFTSTAYRIGSSLDSRNEHFYGYVDEVRFTKYARTVTTVPTAAFPIQ